MTQPQTTTAPQAEAAAQADLPGYCCRLADQARRAGRRLATMTDQQRSAALRHIAEALERQAPAIIEANAKDLETGRQMDLSSAMLDRLRLDEKRIAQMAESVRQIAQQTDPVGRVVEGYTRPNGLRLERVRVPIGVILFIYESRPNVTSDAAALCIKSGNAIILRGGREAIHSNTLLTQTIREGLEKAGIEPDAVQLVQTTDRAAVGELLKLEGRIDLVIPRGGEGLIRAVVEQSRIPVIKHYAGNCHLYIDARCDEQMALDVTVNAKTQRPGVCNAIETLLVHREHARGGLLARLCEALGERGVELRGDEAVRKVWAKARPAAEADWDTEFLDLVLAVRVVGSLDEAIEHINAHGSGHTDGIITSDLASAERFTGEVDASGVFINCSTRFADGGEYGLGAEIGISTDKLHARGPMGATDLTTYKWIVRGDGQVRQ